MLLKQEDRTVFYQGCQLMSLTETSETHPGVNRTSTNVNPLFAVDERLERFAVPCVATVSLCTWHSPV